MLPRLLLLLSLSASTLLAQDPAIVRVFTGWRSAASFKRISEYFDGKENTGGETVLRTDPAQRAGFYFQVRVANPGAPCPVRFQLQSVVQGSPTPHTAVFPGELKAGSGIYQLGLTGPEWQDAKSQPVAWYLRVLAEDGRVLASEKSYLWEKPAAK